MVLGVDRVEGLVDIPKASENSMYNKGGGHSVIFVERF